MHTELKRPASNTTAVFAILRGKTNQDQPIRGDSDIKMRSKGTGTEER